MEQLDQYRPDKPTCAETAVKDRMDEFLLSPSGIPGLTKIEALLLKKYEHALENPDSFSFGDLAKISAPSKNKHEVEAGSGLLDVFARFSETPVEIVGGTKEGDE